MCSATTPGVGAPTKRAAAVFDSVVGATMRRSFFAHGFILTAERLLIGRDCNRLKVDADAVFLFVDLSGSLVVDDEGL